MTQPNATTPPPATPPSDVPATDYIRSLVVPLETNQTVHYIACEKLLCAHRFWGIVIVVVSAVAMGFAFGGMQFLGPKGPQIVGCLTLVAGVLAGFQTFSDFSGRAAGHQSAAIGYGVLVRKCRARVSGAYLEEDNKTELEDILKEWTLVSEHSPLSKQRLRKKAECQLAKRRAEANKDNSPPTRCCFFKKARCRG